MRCILSLVELLLAGDASSIEVRREVHDEFNKRVDAENLAMAWAGAR